MALFGKNNLFFLALYKYCLSVCYPSSSRAEKINEKFLKRETDQRIKNVANLSQIATSDCEVSK